MITFGLTRILTQAGPLLIDFDGPICSVFANYRPNVVASELRELVLEAGIQLPRGMMNQSDPLEILRWTATVLNPTVARAVEDSLCSAELRAVASARPTPHAREVLSAASQNGHRIT
jgi:hypothetical protein